MRLIADIGGTNSRLALSESGQVIDGSTRQYVNADWDSLYALIADFLSHHARPQISEAVVAVAGPVHADHAELTNFHWSVEAAQLAALIGAPHVRLLNDLTALGHAAPELRDDQLKLIRSGNPKQSALSQSLVVGMGTGFNVSPVLRSLHQVICPAVEAGHIAMPYSILAQLAPLALAPESFPTIESLFSGGGLTNFARHMTGQPDLTGPAIIAAYGDPKIAVVVDQYAAFLGILLQELSLAYMPSAGIYLAGSVARSLMPVTAGPCILAFERNASGLLHPHIPIWTINDDLAALTGCAKFEM